MKLILKQRICEKNYGKGLLCISWLVKTSKMTVAYPTHPQSGLLISSSSSCSPGPPRWFPSVEGDAVRHLIAAVLSKSLFMYKSGKFHCVCLSVLNSLAILLHFPFLFFSSLGFWTLEPCCKLQSKRDSFL